MEYRSIDGTVPGLDGTINVTNTPFIRLDRCLLRR